MTVGVLWLFLTVPWVGLQCLIVVFPDHSNLLVSDTSIVRFVLILPFLTSVSHIRAMTCDFQQCGFLTQTSLCSLLLSLETPNDVQSVA